MVTTSGVGSSRLLGTSQHQVFRPSRHWDFLRVRNDRDGSSGEWFFGNAGPQGVEVFAGDLIHWTSDESVVKDGWEICIEEEPPAVLPTGTFAVTSGNCSVRHNCVVSPYHPDAYDSSACSIEVNKRGTIDAMSFGTQLGVDVMYVDGNEFSGDDGPHVDVSAGDVILWSADDTVHGTGWEICIEHRWGYAYEDWYLWDNMEGSLKHHGYVGELCGNLRKLRIESQLSATIR